MQRAPSYGDVVAEVAQFFEETGERLVAVGVEPERIAFDPGIGFGKTVEHNLLLLRDLPRLKLAGRPIVVGVSRKSFMGKVTGVEEMEQRLAPTVAVTSLARSAGCSVFRVHDVAPNLHALRMTEAILAAGRGS